MVAGLDKMLIFVPVLPGLHCPGGGGRVTRSALERRKSSLLYDRVKVKYLCQHIYFYWSLALSAAADVKSTQITYFRNKLKSMRLEAILI